MASSADKGIGGNCPKQKGNGVSCPQHQDKALTGYCVHHAVNYCEECDEEHRLCIDTTSLKETSIPFFGDTKDSCTELQDPLDESGDSNTEVKYAWSPPSETGDLVIDVTEALKEASSDISHIMCSHEGLLTNIRKRNAETTRALEHMIALIKNKLNQLRNEQIRMHSEQEKIIIENIDTLKNLRDKVELAIKDIDNSLDTGQNEQETKEAGRKIIKESKNNTNNFRNVAEIKETDYNSVAIGFVDRVKDFCDMMFTFSVESFKKVDFKERNDRNTCTIMGTCLLEESETLFVTDWKNKKLKRLDNAYTICDSMEFPDNVCDVCQTDINQLAVTMPLKKTIQFVNIADRMKLAGQFVVGDTDEDVCRAICCFDNKIIVNCGGLEVESSAKIFTKQGELLQTIQTNQNNSKFFEYPTDVDVSHTLGRLFISDEQNGILTFTKLGYYIRTLTIPDIRYPTGIYPFMDCWLLACCFDTNTVYLVHKDGLETKILVPEIRGIKCPLSPCFDRKRSKLFVGMQNSNIVPVFDIKKILRIPANVQRS